MTDILGCTAENWTEPRSGHLQPLVRRRPSGDRAARPRLPDGVLRPHALAAIRPTGA